MFLIKSTIIVIWQLEVSNDGIVTPGT